MTDKYIEPSIVPFIDSQFDVRYREEYPDFVEFVRAYYEWMEQAGGTNYLTRGFLDLRDVDRGSLEHRDAAADFDTDLDCNGLGRRLQREVHAEAF